MKNIKSHTVHLLLLANFCLLTTDAQAQKSTAAPTAVSQAHFFTRYPSLTVLQTMLDQGLNINEIYNE